MLYTKFRACTHVSTWFVIFPGKWTFRGNFEAKIFSSHKNLSHIITCHIFHLICLSFQYPTDPSSISHEGKDCERARTRMSSVCTESFLFYLCDSMGSDLYLRLPQGASITACDRDERVTVCHLPNWQTLLSRIDRESVVLRGHHVSIFD